MMHASGHMYPTGMGQGMEMDPEVLKMAMEAVTLNTVMGIHAFFFIDCWDVTSNITSYIIS